jgi:drug/metabolite transporter (DMT)-like permease
MSTGTLLAGAPTSPARADREGLVLCAVSAAGFGAMAVLAKLAYEAGVGVIELLAVRFTIAAALLAVLGAHMRRDRPHPGARTVLSALALGAIAYTAESGLFFAALHRMGASVAELLLYAYPSLVVVGAIMLGREQASRRRGGALALASAGVVLVLVGGEAGALDPVGVLLALGAAAGYTSYILVADTVGKRIDALGLATLVCAGAAVSFTVAGLATGSLHFAFGLDGWLAISAIAVFSTVVPLFAFLAGMERIGPGKASILSALEPPITLLLAFAVFSEELSPIQLLGGGLVVGAVVVLQAKLGSRRAALPARAAAARPLREARAYRERLGV